MRFLPFRASLLAFSLPLAALLNSCSQAERTDTTTSQTTTSADTVVTTTTTSSSTANQPTSDYDRVPRYTSASAGYAALTPAQVRPTYEQFVQNLKAHENEYGPADWRAVQADWQALNARKEQLEGQISLADRAEIKKEQLKYAALKVTDRDADDTDDDYADGDTTHEGAYRAGQAIGRGANKVGRAIDKGAEKVGDAAKDVFRGIRDADKPTESQRK